MQRARNVIACLRMHWQRLFSIARFIPLCEARSMTTSAERQIRRSLRALDEFRRDVSELEVEELDCEQLERRLQELVNGIGCSCMQEVLQRADTKVSEVEYGGERWGNRRESPGTYETRFGEVKLNRSIYSRSGGGPVLVPLELRLGLVEGRYTAGMGRILTRAKALMTSREAAELLREVGVAQVSESTLDRIPKAVAARYEQQRDQINVAIRESEVVPDAATVVQVSLDGVMVPQDGERARPRGRKSEVAEPPRHERRYGALAGPIPPAEQDGEAGRAWHEATVGTLAFWDEDGQHLRTIYIGRMPESGQGTVASELDEELLSALGQRPDLEVSFASDGDAHQWTLLQGISVPVCADPNRKVSYVLDFFHAAEYLHAAADAVLDGADAKVQAEQWKATLKEYEDGAQRVLKSMRYFRDHESRPKRRQAIDEAIKYLATQSRAGRMNYKAALDLGHPIGTGVTEAAAKTLVNVRMKRAGARYDQHGGQTILTFRAALLSERFDTLWRHLHESYKGRVREAA
jgi:hypothetical protein